jgi:hypothetical protein
VALPGASWVIMQVRDMVFSLSYECIVKLYALGRKNTIDKPLEFLDNPAALFFDFSLAT